MGGTASISETELNISVYINMYNTAKGIFWEAVKIVFKK